MATIKKGKSAQTQERVLTQTTVNANRELTIKLWDPKIERMETINFTREETDRLDGRLQVLSRPEEYNNGK